MLQKNIFKVKTKRTNEFLLWLESCDTSSIDHILRKPLNWTKEDKKK